MKRIIIDIIRGVIIGIANIIPGVSGATLAISMGIYDKIIHAVNNIRREFKQSFLYLLPIGIGALVAILGLSKVIDFCFEKYEINTTFLFVGLIIGAMPMLIKRVKGSQITYKNIISFVAGFSFILMFTFIENTGAESNIFPSTNPFILILIGTIGAVSMVIPGLSGSLILAVLGFYRPIISTITSLVDKLMAIDITSIWSEIFVLTFFGIGVIIGIVVFAKIIEILFDKYKIVTFYGIIGIIVASPIALLVSLDFAVFSTLNFILAVAFAAIGFCCAVLLGEK